MVTVDEVVRVVSRLIGAGGRVWVENEKLRYFGPSGSLTEADRVFFREHRDEVIKVIVGGAAVRCVICHQPAALARPDDRLDETGGPDLEFSDLWQAQCAKCGGVFSTANLATLVCSGMVN